MDDQAVYKAFKLNEDLPNPRLSGRHSSGWSAIEVFPKGTVFAVKEVDGELDMETCWFTGPNTGVYLSRKSRPVGCMVGSKSTVKVLIQASSEAEMTVGLTLATMGFDYADLGQAIADQGALEVEQVKLIMGRHEFKQMADEMDSLASGNKQ